MKPIAIVNMVTANVRLQPLNEAKTKKTPGKVKERVVKIFLEAVKLIHFRFNMKSLNVPKIIDIIHMAI